MQLNMLKCLHFLQIHVFGCSPVSKPVNVPKPAFAYISGKSLKCFKIIHIWDISVTKNRYFFRHCSSCNSRYR